MTKMYEVNNRILIYTGYVDPVEHCHMAAHVIVPVDGDLRITSEGKETVCQGVVIPSGMPHMVSTDGKPVLVFLYDCTSDVARQIKDIQWIPETSRNKVIELYVAFEAETTSDRYDELEKYILAQIGVKKTVCCKTDERIISAREYIRARSAEKITCREVADAVYLSQGRFSHLFKEQMGMTFVSYLICQRIISVYIAVIQGKSITEAALEAGFSSSAHFADVNRRVFGISAGGITKNLVFRKIQ